MGRKKRSILLPLNFKASKSFALVKIILIATLSAYLIGLTVWTINVFTHYKGKIKETKGHIKYRHHSQFFVITGLYIATTTGYGLWSTLKENVSQCKKFLFLTIFGFIFELIGSHSSKDEEVKQLKWVTLVFEPILLVLMIIFIRMLISQTKDFIYSPQYRRKMAETPRNSSDEEDDIDEIDTLNLIPSQVNSKTRNLQRKHPFQSFFGNS
uniref:Uncharacterized protein n=1 Tax=Tetranychus urticae TaxID=32264 RepID=T1KPU5_TETUR